MNASHPIYLDYNATTPILKEVADEMAPYLYEFFGNPSSTHPSGWKPSWRLKKPAVRWPLRSTARPQR